jgi:D-alanyl-D-alanine dipeptidase
MLNYKQKIPKISFPSIKNYSIKGEEEDIVDLRGTSNKIIVNSAYFEQGIPGAPHSCYLRETPAKMLITAAEMLPDNLYFMVLDGWRPYVVQRRLWEYYYKEVKFKPENAGLSIEELELKTSFFVSKPSEDENIPFLHSTGGSVDLTICDSRGIKLDMGTEFDDFSDKAWTNHFEEYSDNERVRDNRRLLYNIMIETGFTNLPSEWWHYDYGTKFWGYFKGTDALYKGKLHMDNIKSFPLT